MEALHAVVVGFLEDRFFAVGVHAVEGPADGPDDPNDPAFVAKGYKIVRFGSEPVIVVRVSEMDFRAFSAVCTHLACIVEYRKANQVIACNCHNGQFNLQGQVMSGPPPKPLPPFSVHIVAGAGGSQQVIVSRS